jgi:hypothetical protein
MLLLQTLFAQIFVIIVNIPVPFDGKFRKNAKINERKRTFPFHAKSEEEGVF